MLAKFWKIIEKTFSINSRTNYFFQKKIGFVDLFLFFQKYLRFLRSHFNKTPGKKSLCRTSLIPVCLKSILPTAGQIVGLSFG